MLTQSPRAADLARTRDITIIGAGPTGLIAGFWAGMRRASCRIVDTLPAVGGQLMALYPDKPIYDVPGYVNVKARDLVDVLARQSIDPFDIPVHLETTALSFTRVADPERPGESLVAVDTDRGRFLSRTLIVAAGHGAFKPKTLPQVDCAAWLGKGLHYFVPGKEAFKNRRVAIVGGGDSACDWAVELLDTAREITLVHRREGFTAHEHTREQIRTAESQGKMNLAVPYQVRQIVGEDRVRGIKLGHSRLPGDERALDVDDILVQLGFQTGLGPLASWGFAIERGAIVVNELMGTNLANIWACGDVVASATKIRLIATGFAQAAVAVSHAVCAIRPDTELQPEHSTTTGVPATPGGDRPSPGA